MILALKIIATVFLGLSCITCFFKNLSIFSREGTKKEDLAIILTTIYGLIWRIFIIIIIWRL